MSKVHRTGARSLVGQEFYEIEELGCWSFCPDSNDASTPATQVHMHITLAAPPGLTLTRTVQPPMVCRFHGPGTLDAFIESLIEHRTYVFGRREWDATKYEEQKQ
jgi:hypothetical protein